MFTGNRTGLSVAIPAQGLATMGARLSKQISFEFADKVDSLLAHNQE